ncbi:tRNA pseudouridine32 synthase / 23S rRNA pseudouridine746 synthase [Oryzisolibacter propanilivorax]|uniref:tRNA pseudouridine32 synthase / 23S rRNA pseudouridine746 synthase n=1 Tax=Oryzisolibacter propanilivorax TaxID=1527607 RepID=A0A1G9PAY6_9BURK|nr:pseudouridine synthase [Oryzisolibacter propanilivorax]SDL95387.1 tRNA pseudouridine32 synthase / 23S rRNA pseudouridine746 synthase [Oryzisolibacter propanilivorax]
MHNPHDPRVLPLRDGVSPSCVVLPSVGQGLLLDFLAIRLPAVTRTDWVRRMAAGEVVDELARPARPDTPFTPGLRYYYYREVAHEQPVPFHESVLYQDAHIVVADKPHFLPVLPAGGHLQHTLLVRLRRRLGLPELSPVHRIDAGTAGLVLLCVQRAERGRYQALFRERAVRKLYEAIAPWRADLPLPRVYESRLEECGHFFRMHEVPGVPNAITAIDVIERLGPLARYRLEPVTGKRHQLRVQMAALGMPLVGETLYPQVRDAAPGDYSHPLQLLAREISFTDPVTQERWRFTSQLRLRALAELVDAASHTSGAVA